MKHLAVALLIGAAFAVHPAAVRAAGCPAIMPGQQRLPTVGFLRIDGRRFGVWALRSRATGCREAGGALRVSLRHVVRSGAGRFTASTRGSSWACVARGRLRSFDGVRVSCRASSGRLVVFAAWSMAVPVSP